MKSEEGEQAEQKSETNEAAKIRNALEEHDQQRCAERVNREMLPFGNCVGHDAGSQPSAMVMDPRPRST
jgi:hypothetical protein